MAKKPSASFQEKDVLFSTFINNTAGLVIVFDAKGKIIYFNPAFEKIAGYPLDEVFGKCYWDIFLSPDERELFKAFFENLEITDFPFNHESHIISRDEKIHYILWSYNIESSDDENIDFVFCTGIDITERSLNEEAIRKISENTSAIINALPMSVISLDKECRVMSWNTAAERLFGWEEEEALGKQNLIFSESEKDEFSQWCDYVLTGKALARIEMRARKKDGSYVDISLSQAPLRDVEGSVIGMIAIIADITDQKKSEESLKKDGEHLRLITDNIMDVVSLNTVDGICKFVSPSIKNILGYDSHEMLGDTLFDYVHPDDLRGLIEDFQGFSESSASIRKEIRIRHTENYYACMEVVAKPVFDKKKRLNGIVISSRIKHPEADAQ